MPPPRRTITARRSPLVLLLAGLLAVGLTGCGTEDDLIGTGPVRSIERGQDGTAFVLRAWRDRTPNAAVLLNVDPATGEASPILPKLPGRRGATIRTIELAVPRPAGAGAGRETDGAPDAAADPPAAVELLVSGPDIGLALIRGPFAYLGAFPVIEPVTEQRLLPPVDGPAAAVSPGGGHLLLFALEDERPTPGAAVWTPMVVDLATLKLTPAGDPQSDRRGRWTAARTGRLGEDGGFLVAADGSISFVAAAADDDAPSPALQADPPRLRLDRGDAPPLTVSLAEPADGFTAWPPAPDPGAPAGLLGLLWRGASVQRVEIGPGGEPRVVPLPLTFDRQR